MFDKETQKNLPTNYKELPKADCKITQYFLDSYNPKGLQIDYCKKNCQEKCLKEKEVE